MLAALVTPFYHTLLHPLFLSVTQFGQEKATKVVTQTRVSSAVILLCLSLWFLLRATLFPGSQHQGFYLSIFGHSWNRGCCKQFG